jgi:hypothetical protein
MVNLVSLSISGCNVSASDLAPLAVVNLQSLDISRCRAVSDLAPLGALVNLQILRLFEGDFSLADLPALQRRIDRGDELIRTSRGSHDPASLIEGYLTGIC